MPIVINFNKVFRVRMADTMNTLVAKKKMLKARIDTSMPHRGTDGQLTLKPTESIRIEDSSNKRFYQSAYKIQSAASVTSAATPRSERGFMNVFPKFETRANLTNYFFGKTKTEMADSLTHQDKASDMGNQNRSTQFSTGFEPTSGIYKAPRIPACFLKKYSCKEKAQESTFWLKSSRIMLKPVHVPTSITVAKASNLNRSLKHLQTEPSGYVPTPTSVKNKQISFYM